MANTFPIGAAIPEITAPYEAADISPIVVKNPTLPKTSAPIHVVERVPAIYVPPVAAIHPPEE